MTQHSINNVQRSKVVITGSNGQLGWELQRTAPEDIHVVAVGKDNLDITDKAAVVHFIASTRPDIIINAAAYTSVDKAEQEPDIAYAINCEGAANLAQAAVNVGARLIHISTDFVFDGNQSRPYMPGDVPNPLGIYGASKLAGEQAVAAITHGQYVILRTAWLYSCRGHNFVKTMLRLLRERKELGVVVDQIGTPSWANGLASTIWRFAGNTEHTGIFHWTDAGVASWYDFAVAIQEEAYSLGLIARTIPITPINTVDYPMPAKRPAYSVLDKTLTWKTLGLPCIHWRESLRSMLKEFNDSGR